MAIVNICSAPFSAREGASRTRRGPFCRDAALRRCSFEVLRRKCSHRARPQVRARGTVPSDVARVAGNAVPLLRSYVLIPARPSARAWAPAALYSSMLAIILRTSDHPTTVPASTGQLPERQSLVRDSDQPTKQIMLPEFLEFAWVHAQSWGPLLLREWGTPRRPRCALQLFRSGGAYGKVHLCLLQGAPYKVPIARFLLVGS